MIKDYLLDTHSFLWTVFDPKKLSEPIRDTITNPNHRIIVSSITFWEISLKSQLGKLDLVNCFPDDLPDIAAKMGIEVINLDDRIAASFFRLPKRFHKDPFDRMIIWLAIQNNFILISKDKQFSAYSEFGLKTAW